MTKTLFPFAMGFYALTHKPRHHCGMDTFKAEENIIRVFRQRTEGLERWIENEDYPSRTADACTIQTSADDPDHRALLINRLSISVYLFYRFSNGPRIWNITEEDFRAFGATSVWQENSPYPKHGDMRRWLEAL